MTIKQVAEEVGVSYQAVLIWCQTGKLKAKNIAPEGAGRARWEIEREDVDAFKAARSS